MRRSALEGGKQEGVRQVQTPAQQLLMPQQALAKLE